MARHTPSHITQARSQTDASAVSGGKPWIIISGHIDAARLAVATTLRDAS